MGEDKQEDGLDKHLDSAEQLEQYLRDKAKTHTAYKIYGVEERLKDIYENHYLYLTSGHGWNDVADMERFQSSDRYTYFARCFSYSGTENVAMWMLYGGMKKKGIMVDFGSAFMKNIVENTKEVTLGYFENNTFHILHNFKKPEWEELYLTDIIYLRETPKESKHYEPGLTKYDIKRHDENVYREMHEVSYINSRILDQKDYAWNYENECRMILKIKKELTEGYTQKNLFARIDFNSLFDVEKNKRIHIIRSPNYNTEGSVVYPPNIPWKPSKLTGHMQWDLCKGCFVKHAKHRRFILRRR